MVKKGHMTQRENIQLKFFSLQMYLSLDLRCMGIPPCFPPFLQRGTTFEISCLLPCLKSLYKMGFTLNGKKEQVVSGKS